MAALSEVDLALRIRTLSSLVQPSFSSQENAENNPLALRLSALLDCMEDLVHRQPLVQQTLKSGKYLDNLISVSDWQATLDQFLTSADRITKNDPYFQLSMVLDGADDLRKFSSDMERCKELDNRGVMELPNLADDSELCRRIRTCAETQAQQQNELKQISQSVLTYLGRYNDFVSRFSIHDKVDQISRIFLTLDQNVHRLERQIARDSAT